MKISSTGPIVVVGNKNLGKALFRVLGWSHKQEFHLVKHQENQKMLRVSSIKHLKMLGGPLSP